MKNNNFKLFKLYEAGKIGGIKVCKCNLPPHISLVNAYNRDCAAKDVVITWLDNCKKCKCVKWLRVSKKKYDTILMTEAMEK